MRRIVITGASAGIGAALARQYADADTVIALVARRREPMQALASSLPGRFEIYALDVSDSAALERTAREFCSRHGAPDLVIANAGISVGTHGDDPADVANLRRVLEVNVTGLAATLAAFAPAMRAQRRGILCGISSVAGFRGLPGAGAYSASKSAVIKWLEALRVELAGSGVSVVTICPGYIDTPMTQVNRYRMPFLLSADEAARRIARAIAEPAPGGDSLADGLRFGAAAPAAAPVVRPHCRARAAQAARSAALKMGLTLFFAEALHYVGAWGVLDSF